MKISKLTNKTLMFLLSSIIFISSCTAVLAFTKPESENLKNEKSNVITYPGNQETDRYIVKYKNGTGREKTGKIKNKVNTINQLKDKRFDVIKTNNKMKSEDVLAMIKSVGADTDIEYIQPDYEMVSSSTDPKYDEQWGLYNKSTEMPDVSKETNKARKAFLLYDALVRGIPEIRIDANVPQTWDKTQGQGVVVAVLDTGIDTTHEDLVDNIWTNGAEIPGNGIDDDGNGYIDDVNGWNFSEGTNQIHSQDQAYDEWHGTHVAGIIAAGKDNQKGISGVAPNAKIMPLKVFKNGIAYTSNIINAINYAEKNGAKIVNCSWGTGSYNPALKECIESSSMLFVCAAGNEHKDIGSSPVYPAAFNSSNLISVASINNDGALSGFSNFNESLVNVAAPGNEIISTIPGNSYAKSGGTSMSAAFVSGEAALLLSSDNKLSSADIKNRIITSCDKLSTLEGKVQGGKINCYNALNNLSSEKVYTIKAVDYDSEITSLNSSEYSLYASDSWSAKAAMPTARRHLGAAEVDGKIYAVGGLNGSGITNKLEQYDISTNTWTTKLNMPTAREGAAVAAAYGKIYVIGGYSTDYLNKVEEYDPATNTWAIKANMPTSRCYAGITVVNGKIYVIGGYNGSYLNTVEVYNPLSNTWEIKAVMTTARSQIQAETVNGKIYTIGGNNGSYTSVVQEYDPSSDVWTTKTSMPTARGGFSSAVVNNRINAIGGHNGANCLDVVEEYLPDKDIWVTKTPMSTAKAYTAAAVFNSTIYIIGGYNGSYLNNTDAFIPSTDIWVTKSPMPTARCDFGIAMSNSKIYIAGGALDGSKYSPKLEMYDPVADTWTTKANLLSNRVFFGAAEISNKIYVMGGLGDSSLNSSVEVYDTTTNTWSFKATMPNPRFAHGVVTYNSSLYVIGGDGLANGDSNLVEEYNPSTNAWVTKTNMPTARRGMAVISASNGKIYAIGGFVGNNEVSCVEEYNPSTNTWSTKASIPTAVANPAVAEMNGRIYVYGGDTLQAITNKLQIYDIAANKWFTGPSMKNPRTVLGGASYNGKIYAIGGLYGNNYLNIVEEYKAQYDIYVIPNHFGEEGANPATGNYSRTYNDMSMKTAGFELNISRTYNSKDSRVGPFGKGWTFGFEGCAKVDTTNTSLMVVKLPNGSTQSFYLNTNGSYSALDSRSTFVKNADNTYTLTTKDQYKYNFNTNGWLVSMLDSNSNAITLSVDTNGKVTQITDPSGRYFSVDYAGTNYIRYIRDNSGSRQFEYQYNASNQLSKVIDPLLNVTNYSYDTSGFLNEIKDHNLNRIEFIVYDHVEGENKDKISQITDAYGNIFTYSYNNATGETTITDKNGKKTVSSYDNCYYVYNTKDADEKTTIVEYNTDNGGINRYGEERSVTDRNGNKTVKERDSRGNITRIINPDLSYKEYTYDDKNNVLSERDEMSKYTFYIYDTNGINLIKKIQPINGTDLYYTGCNDSSFAITTYTYYTEAERIQLGYKVKGLLKSVTDPENNTITYTYNSYGDVLTVSDPETSKNTTYEYNSIGWKTAEITAKGYRTDYTYDKNGRLEKTVLQGGGETTRITYDYMGRKTKEVSPNLYDSSKDNIVNHIYSGDHGYRYTYLNNGKIGSQTDPENNITTYTYDDYGNVDVETKPNGSMYQYTYDSINRLNKVYYKDNAGVTQYTLLEDYTYNINNGQSIKTFTKHLSSGPAISQFYYDYAGMLVKQVNPDNTFTTTAYNTNGTILSTTDANGHTTYYKYDGLNRLSEKWSPIEQSGSNVMYSYTKYDCDKASRKNTEKYGKEKVTLYSLPSTFVYTSYTYYKNGKVNTITNSSGSIKKYYYDDDGNVNKEENYTDATNKNVIEYTNGYLGKPTDKKVHIRAGDLYGNSLDSNTDIIKTTIFTYDKNGNLKTAQTPDTIVTTYGYDNMDRQISVSQPGKDEFDNSTTIGTTTLYNWQGKPLTSTDAKGNITTYTYDQRGYPKTEQKKVKVSGIEKDVITGYMYDLFGRKIAEISPENYDGTKTKVTDMTNRIEYSYDLMDRIVTKSFIGKEKQYKRDIITGTWAWTDVDLNIVLKAYKYDNNGNVVKELDTLGYEAGTGTIVSDKINSGYGKEYIYNHANLVESILDPDSKERSLSYTQKFGYDALGRKSSETDGKEVITNYYYNDAGKILSVKVKKTVSDPEQTVKSYTYDYLGNIKTQTDGNGHTVSFDYNVFNKLRKEIHQGDSSIPVNTITCQYDSVGNLMYKQDITGTVNLYTYDNQYRLLSSTEKKLDGTQSIPTSVKYDKNGNKRFETDGRTNTKENKYDELNRLTDTIISVNGIQQTTSYGYDLNGNQISTTDWRGNTWTNSYDKLGRLYEKRDSIAVIQRLEYNHNSVQVRSYDALNKKTEFSYDKNNRQRVTTDPETYTISQTYDNAGNVNTKTDGRNNTTTYTYDEFNRLKTVLNAKNETTSYTYDLDGNILVQTDGKGNTTTYEYNVADKPVRKIDCGGRTGSPGSYVYDNKKVESYTYYADGELASKVDRNGNTTNYIYDSHKRLLSQAIGTSTISYTYDNNGNQLTMTDSTGTTTRTYDELNRVKTKVVPIIGTTSFTYDITTGVPAGCWAESTSDPKANYSQTTYDRAGRIYQVIAEGNTTTYSYYDNGNKKSVLYPDGTKQEYTYYDGNMLWTLTTKKPDASIMDSYSYTYDNANNQSTKYEKINGVEKGTTSYEYDALNRLTKVTEPGTGGKVTSYSYDAAGNRDIETVIQGGTATKTTYAYNEQNRLTSATTTYPSGAVDVISYNYDNNGNLIYKGKETTKAINSQDVTSYNPVLAGTSTDDLSKSMGLYEYNVWNQLISAITGDQTATYVYNGEGYRVEKTVNGQLTRYLYEYDKVILEVDSAGNQLANYLYGTNLISKKMGAYKAYYVYNGHGDVTALINATTWNVDKTYYYDAFGNILEQTGSVSNSITYAGYQFDTETGLYYLNARYYDSKIARFLSEDTYLGNAADPLSLNLYTYCYNNPLIYSDPTGHVVTDNDRATLTDEACSLIQMYTDNWIYYNGLMSKYAKDSDDYKKYYDLRELQHIRADEVRGSSQYKKSTNNISPNSVPSTPNPVPSPPSTYNNNQQAQYYLDKIGFDVGKSSSGKMDGIMGVKSSSALIVVQWFAGIEITGETDDEYLLKTLKYLADKGITYEMIRALASPKEEGGFWEPEESTISRDRESNGYLPKDDMVRLPTTSGGDAYAEKNTAVAWAMMVQGAVQYNKNPTEATDYKKVNINSFALQGPNSGYRAYHEQVEAWIDNKYLNGHLAADVSKNWENPGEALKWLNANKKYFKKNPHWSNVPNSITADGGPLDGYGKSDHGWGVALDMNLGSGTYCHANSPAAQWLEAYGSEYGFSGLLDNSNAVKKGAAPVYKEMWHWNYMK